MNRPGLAELGVHLPPLAVTSAGALPATPTLREARRAHARAVLSDAELAEEAQRAGEYWIAVQDRLGVDVLVDGDLDARDLVCRFADGLAGFTPGGLVRIYGDRYRRKPIIAGPVSWREPISVEGWQALQSLTTRPLKARVTGPYTLARWSFDAQYSSRAAACLAIAAALRQEVNALVAAGARVVQIDEPALAEPDAEWELAAEALRLVTTGVGAYVVAHTGQHGDSTAGELPSGRFGLPVDNLEIPGLGDPDGLPDGMHASIDVFAPGPRETPTSAAIDARLQAAVGAYGSERLWISSSWRLGAVSPDRAEAHLEAVVRAAATLRGDSPAAEAAAALVEVEAAPIEVEVAPAEGEEAPAEAEVTSAEAEVTPAEAEVTPAEAEAAPAEAEATPVEEAAAAEPVLPSGDASSDAAASVSIPAEDDAPDKP